MTGATTRKANRPASAPWTSTNEDDASANQGRGADTGNVVIVLCNNAETLDGMHSYLSRAGLSSSGSRALNRAAWPSRATRALVIFPDDFSTNDVAAYLSSVRAEYPELAVIIVTREPRSYEIMTAAGRPLRAVVLPRPAFGWTILDAIRAASS